jgi:hypothetical protein
MRFSIGGGPVRVYGGRSRQQVRRDRQARKARRQYRRERDRALMRSIADAASRWRAGQASGRDKTVVVFAVASAAVLLLAVLVIAVATA